MTSEKKIAEKNYQYLIHLLDTDYTRQEHELLTHSSVFHIIYNSTSILPTNHLKVLVHPELYKKYLFDFEKIGKTILAYYIRFTNLMISDIKFVPDLDKFIILENRFAPIFTQWEEINLSQNILFDQLRKAQTPIDFQNIGNSCRTILQKLSGIVFVTEKHIAKGIDLSEGKFKNRLHTFIKTELAGEKNKELRDFSISLINTTEDSIDVTNKLTHDLNATKMAAELCIISTMMAINTVKLIAKH